MYIVFASAHQNWKNASSLGLFTAQELGNLLPQNKEAVAAFSWHSQAACWYCKAQITSGSVQDAGWQSKGPSERNPPAECSSYFTSWWHAVLHAFSRLLVNLLLSSQKVQNQVTSKKDVWLSQLLKTDFLRRNEKYLYNTRTRLTKNFFKPPANQN